MQINDGMTADDGIDAIVRKKRDEAMPAAVHLVKSRLHEFQFDVVERCRFFEHERLPPRVLLCNKRGVFVNVKNKKSIKISYKNGLNPSKICKSCNYIIKFCIAKQGKVDYNESEECRRVSFRHEAKIGMSDRYNDAGGLYDTPDHGERGGIRGL